MRTASIIVLSLALCIGCRTSGGTPGDDERNIRATIATYEAAWNEHRPEQTQRFFAEDAEVTNVVGVTKRGRAGATAFSQSPQFQAMYSAARQHFDDVAVRFLTGNLAAVDVRWTMTGARHLDGTPWEDRRGLLNLIMTKENGGWLIELFHNAEFPDRSTPAPDKAEADILNLERLRRDAQLRGDWQAIQNINAPDFTEISAAGAIRTATENSEAMRSGVLKFTAVEYSDQQVHAYGDVAFVTGVAQRSGSFNAAPFQQHSRYTRIYVRRDGSWKAVFAQNTRIDASPQ